MEPYMQDLQVRAKAGQYGKLISKVADAISANHELSASIQDGQRVMRTRDQLIDFSDHRMRLSCNARYHKFNQVVMMSRLKQAALAQIKELAALNEERALWMQRSFPNFAHLRPNRFT
jgi:hypothetical protein